MTILYLLTRPPEPPLETILREQKKQAAVTLIDLSREKDYDRIIEQIEAADRVISW